MRINETRSKHTIKLFLLAYILQSTIFPIAFAFEPSMYKFPEGRQHLIGVGLNNLLSPDAPSVSYEHLPWQEVAMEYAFGYFTFWSDDYRTGMFTIGANPKYLIPDLPYFVGMNTQLRFLNTDSKADVMLESFDTGLNSFSDRKSETEWKTSMQQLRLEPHIGTQWVLDTDWLLVVQAGYSWLALEQSQTKLSKSELGLSPSQQKSIVSRQENRVQRVFSDSHWLVGIKLKYYF